MAEPQDYKESLVLTIETEREYVCSVVPEDEVTQKDEKLQGRDVRRVNIVAPVQPVISSSFCKKPGHDAINCLASARVYVSSGWQNTPGPYDRTRNMQQEEPNVSFGGWNGENRRRVQFLPESRSFERTRGSQNPINNFSCWNNSLGDSPNYPNYRRDAPSSNNSSSNIRYFPDVVCYYCYLKGYMKRDCLKLEADAERGKFAQGNYPTPSPAGAEREMAIAAPVLSNANKNENQEPSVS